MEELQDLIKFLKDKGLEHHKINVDVLCGIIEYFASKQETKQCTITDVSQQRELLNGFRDWLIDERKNIHFYRHLIDDYLETI